MTDKEKLKEIKKLANAMYYAAKYSHRACPSVTITNVTN